MSATARSVGPYRGLSLWHDMVADDLAPRPALTGDRQVDVAIVGAGYTGLWTAYHLAVADPTLRIAVVDKEIAGYGPSGRNGGWCSALFPTSLRRLAAEGGRDGAVRLQNRLNETVVEVGRVAADEGIDCSFQQGGYLSVARNRAQLARARAEEASWRSWGFDVDDFRLVDAAEAASMGRLAGTLGGTWTPHCAALDPQRLVRGLADAVERRGISIFEQTSALALRPGQVQTTGGLLTAEHVVLATEGYTPMVAGYHRDVVPMYSLMVATDPLPDALWEQIGLEGRTTFADKRHLRIYGQRTADGRIAFGGRGAPYHFGSRVSPDFDRDDRVHAMLRRILVELFPALEEVAFTHAWGGNLGIPREWFPSVRLDAATGMGFAGGYVGDGVATAALAGRTLAAMIRRDDPDDLTTLPWAGRRSRSWEPEPVRWLGVNAVTALFAGADLAEQRTGRPSRAAATFWKALGH